MKIEVFSDVVEVALAAARYLASVSRDTVAAEGKFVVALSGGNTPWLMLNALAQEHVPWTATHLLQVDERVVPAGNPIGADGHTASLVPGDRVLDKTDTDVAITNVYQGARRMTLTYPILNRARRILWVVTGKEKADALVRLQARDLSIPAGRVRPDRAVIFADRDAADRGR